MTTRKVVYMIIICVFVLTLMIGLFIPALLTSPETVTLFYFFGR